MSEFGAQIKIKYRLLWSALFILVAVPSFAFERETPVVLAVRNVGPAVVNISSEHIVQNRISPFGPSPLFDQFFQDFFERRPERRTSLGSGVIIDGKQGFILTNAHVIEKAASIKVVLQDERQFDVRIVGTDPDSDLAVLQIEPQAVLPSVQMGDSDDIMIGETIIAIGNPFGFSHTVTTGVVSAVGRSIKANDQVFHEFIQTDASINPGNSGGPLLNIKGELIGINTAIYAKAQGIGFAIPINKAKRIVSDLIQHGHVVPAWIGLSVQHLDARLQAYMGAGDLLGAVVSGIEEGSPAQKAGILQGDLILAFGRRKLSGVDDYNSAVRGISPGEKVRLSLWRKGAVQDVDIKSRQYPLERVPQLAWRRLGVEVKTIDASMRRHFRLSADRGVVFTNVRSGSPLATIGVKPGDALLQIDGKSIADESDFSAAMLNSLLKTSVLVLIQRADQLYHLNVRMAP
jgi:serine protease Do